MRDMLLIPEHISNTFYEGEKESQEIWKGGIGFNSVILPNTEDLSFSCVVIIFLW